MLPLYLLASHLVGDFVLQTRWQAAGKLVDARLRARHVTAYTAAFVPLALYRDWAWGQPHPGWPWRGPLFLALLWLLHFATDTRRFRSTLGDVLVWRSQHRPRDTGRPWPSNEPLPANPWPPLPILIDQTLHVVQIAALGWLLA